MTKENFRKFNLNRYVWVKLTERGYQHIVDNHNAWLDANPEVTQIKRFTLDGLKERTNVYGYMEFQFHTFMNAFSDVSEISYPDYFDLNVLIEK